MTTKKITNYERKLLNLEKGRETQKKNREAEKNKKLTTEEQLEADLKEIERVEKISQSLFGDKEKIFTLEKKLNKIGNVQFLPSKGKSSGLNLLRIYFTSNKYSNYKSYSRKDVNNKGLIVSKQLKKIGLNGKIYTLLDFDGVIRSGEETKIGENVKIYNPRVLSPSEEDEKEYEYFSNINEFKEIVFFVKAKNENKKRWIK